MRQWSYNGFSFSRDLVRTSDQKSGWPQQQELLKVSHHPTKFGGHIYHGCGDIMVFVNPVISQDYVIRGSCDYGYQPVKLIYHAFKLGGHRHCCSGDIMVFACRVTLQDHRINELCDFMKRSLLRQVNTSHVWWPQKLWQWRYNSFHLSRDLNRPRIQKGQLTL